MTQKQRLNTPVMRILEIVNCAWRKNITSLVFQFRIIC